MPPSPVAELSLDTWNKVRSVDLDGVFYGVRAQLPLLVERGGGAVIAISSIAADRGLLGMAPYSVSKHGVNGLIKTVAWEYGSQGVRALSVGPAYIATGLEQNLPPRYAIPCPGCTPSVGWADPKRWETWSPGSARSRRPS